MARYRAARGTEDLFPERIPLLEHIFGSCREVLERHGYGEIRTPMLEETRLFERSLGDATDVVQKEMFTVTRGDTSVTFRPEGTAPVCRACGTSDGVMEYWPGPRRRDAESVPF